MTAGHYPKRLIEVDLPIQRISAHARREKSIRHGHISTLHIWWARRPLAACRAVICAALWPDPVDITEADVQKAQREGRALQANQCPQAFRKAAVRIVTDFARKVVSTGKLMDTCSKESFSRWEVLVKPDNKLDPSDPAHQNTLRHLLLDFIADFANWDNSTVPEYLEAARALTQAAHEALGGEKGTRPLVVDPFAGGGSIPLEALRVGADAFASDLNPVAVLLNKVVLEYIPKYGHKLADEVRKWGQWVKEQAASELAEYYPHNSVGTTPIAYLWARTIRCEGPRCGLDIPLFTNAWLSNKPGRYKWLGYSGSKQKSAEYSICESVSYPSSPGAGTIRLAAATCPACGYTTPLPAVRKQLYKKQGGAKQARLLAVIQTKKGESGRVYRTPNKSDVEIAKRAGTRLASLELKVEPPTQAINPISPGRFGSGVASPTRIGCETFSDLFTHRQLLALCTFAHYATLVDDVAMRTLLAFAVDRLADYNSAQSRWASAGEFIGNTFGRQAIPIVWCFAEINPFSGASGDWDGAIGWIAEVVEHVAASTVRNGSALRSLASSLPLPDDIAHAVVTDPPYYGSILYSDLADYFFVWLKQTLGSDYPDLFVPSLIDKLSETVATPTSVGPNGETKDAKFFEQSMAAALADARRILGPSGVATIVFAHKSTSGWEALLAAVIEAGWVVTASWPIDTERQARTNAHGSATLASSIHLVCRPREMPDGSLGREVGDWRDVLSDLPKRIHEWMPRLASEGIVGADAIFACLGPALEIFSRYARVEKADGTSISLNEYLEHVWAAVSKEALSMIFAGADATGFEPDARMTAMWLWTLSGGSSSSSNDADKEDDNEDATDDDEEDNGKAAKGSGFVLEYDAARKIAQGLGANLEQLTQLVQVKGDKATLLSVAKRAGHLFGKDKGNAPAKKGNKVKQRGLFDEVDGSATGGGGLGEVSVPQLGDTILDRIHQSMILFAAGRGDALKRFIVEEGVGQDRRFWTLADHLSKLYPPRTDEKRWVDGVLARKKGLGF